MTAASPTSNPLPLGILFACIVIAISRNSQLDKQRPIYKRTLLYVIGWMVVGFGVGTAIGFAFGSSASAGTLAGVMVLVMGIGASIQRIVEANKAKTQ